MDKKKPTILQVALPTPLRSCFDYLLPEELQDTTVTVGMRVRVPFRRNTMIGIVLGIKDHSTYQKRSLKSIEEILDKPKALLPGDIVQLTQWASDYYQYPLGEVVVGTLPRLLREGNPAEFKTITHYFLNESSLPDPLTLKRSPKKLLLLNTLQSSPEGLTREDLFALDISSTLLKTCLNKNWVRAEEIPLTHSTYYQHHPSNILLNSEQSQAVNTITQHLNTFETFVLDGVTGSGKTEVYFHCLEKVLSQGKQVLVLVPEIGLTPQTVLRFKKRFHTPMALLHSKLSPKERLDSWLLAQSGIAKIVIGTRSAIFTPIPHLGMIIVDESHDASYKQQEGFRYSARDIAIKRASNHQIPIILGSATHNIETLHLAEQKKFHYLKLRERAGKAILPRYTLVDIRRETLTEGLSDVVIRAIKEKLEADEQVIVFINRRGFSPVLMCHQCGWVATCKQCDANMTVHLSPRYLRCHHCQSQRRVDTHCGSCNSDNLFSLGVGTERIESALNTLFPEASVARIDRDSTRKKGAFENLLEDIHSKKHHILVGTQMLAKGHHFPGVTLVVIVNVDAGLYSVDFRAAETMAQLILQVAGRAGREETQGHVLLQTRHPENPLLQHLITGNYDAFAKACLEERKESQMPPFSFLALLRAETNASQKTLDFLSQIKNHGESLSTAHTVFLGPVPAPMEKKAKAYRGQLLLQSSHRSYLQKLLKELCEFIDTLPESRKIKWSVDVDPYELG